MPDVKLNMENAALTRSNRGLLREDVYRHLRDQIIDGTLEPGERIRDAELAKQLEVSRTPVREALRRLEDEGLIETWANRWTRVASIDVAEAERIYPVIWTLERLAVTESRPFTAERLEHLTKANERLRSGLQIRDPVLASDADRDFHQVLIDAGENAEIDRISRELKLRMRRLEIHYFGGSLLAERSAAEHQVIIDAIAAGDRHAASQAVEENWRNSLARLGEREHSA